MTTQIPEPVQPAEAQPLSVAAVPASRLEQLHALYPELKAAADDAAQKLKAVSVAIKLELYAAYVKPSGSWTLKAGA